MSLSRNKNIIKYVTITIAVFVAYLIYKNSAFLKAALMDFGIYAGEKNLQQNVESLNTSEMQKAIKDTKKFVNVDSSGNIKLPELNLTGLAGLGLFKIPNWGGINGGGGVLS